MPYQIPASAPCNETTPILADARQEERFRSSAAWRVHHTYNCNRLWAFAAVSLLPFVAVAFYISGLYAARQHVKQIALPEVDTPTTRNRAVDQAHEAPDEGFIRRRNRWEQLMRPTEAKGNVDTSPNIIFFLIDDVGMNDFRRSGSDLAGVLPFLESLADAGVSLGNYHTNAICTASRASILTGRHTFENGMQYEVVSEAAPWGLPKDEVLLSERLQAAGYETHMVGKWHLGMYNESLYPNNRGFDTFLGYMGGEETYSEHKICTTPTYAGAEEGCWTDFGYGDQDGYVRAEEYIGNYSTIIAADRVIDIATSYTEEERESPLFLYIPLQAAHDPVNPPPPGHLSPAEISFLDGLNINNEIRRNFSEVLASADREIARMIHSLDDLGLMENTIVVFASDNGACPKAGGSNYPYRGLKHTLYEGGTLVPAFVYSKTLIPDKARGTTYNGLMHAIDWIPTLSSVIPRFSTDDMRHALSGVSHWKAIVGDWSESEDGPIREGLVLGRNSYTFSEISNSMVPTRVQGAYIYNGWKIIVRERCATWYSFDESDYIPSAQCGNANACDLCVAECHEISSPLGDYLFDLRNDPYEQVNLIHEMPAKYHELVNLWNEACKNEVVPRFKSDEPDAVEKWNDNGGWMIAWR